MRISDDRYNRDRLRFDLAIRMMRHEARTCTIRVLTGLTEDRVRKVFRAYLQHEPSQPVHRHRGKSPQMAGYFLQSTVVNFEATTLACLFYILGVVPREGGYAGAANAAMTLDRAESLCLAYEAYAALHSSPRLSFEHAWFLLGLLLRNEELKLSSCAQCGRLYLTDAARARISHCGCNAHRLGWPRRRRTSKSAATVPAAASPSSASVAISIRQMPADTLPAAEERNILIEDDAFQEEPTPQHCAESMRHDVFL